TRQDKVLEFLNNDKINFLPALAKKNPVTGYRFARRLDEDYHYFDQKGKEYSRTEWEEEQQKTAEKRKPKEEASEFELVRGWSLPSLVSVLLGIPGFVYVAYRFATTVGRGATGNAFAVGVIQLAVLGLVVGGVWFFWFRSQAALPSVVDETQQTAEATEVKP